MKNCSMREGLVKICRGLSLWVRPPTAAEEECEEEGATETYGKLTDYSPPALEGENSGV